MPSSGRARCSPWKELAMTPAPVAALPKPAPDTGGGYQLTEHVRRYYQTAKV